MYLDVGFVPEYFNLYQWLHCPRSTIRIIVIQNTVINFLLRSSKAQRRSLQPVVEILRAYPKEPLLIHVFSNAGAQQVCGLAAAWNECLGSLLPATAMICDSTPSKGTWERAKQMMISLLPKQGFLRMLGIVLANVLLYVVWAVEISTGRSNVLNMTRERMNNPGLISKDTKRDYIFSYADQVVSWEDVVEHSHGAEARGWRVTREVFEGSAHVRHVKVDPRRYWNIVGKRISAMQPG